MHARAPEHAPPLACQVVWERLDAVDGDTQLCGPDFRCAVPVACA